MHSHNKNKPLTIVLLVFIQVLGYNKSNAQDWLRIYNTDTKWSVPYHVKEAYDHGILIQYDFRKYEGAYIQSGIFKTDINGNKLWEKFFGDPASYMVTLKGFDLTPDGGAVICGITTLEDEYGDPFVLKLNSCMIPEWCNVYNTPSWDDGGTDIKYIAWDNTYVLELYNTQYDINEKREFVMKIDFEGNQIWYNIYSTNPFYCDELLHDMNLSLTDSAYVLNGFVYLFDSINGWWEIRPYWLKISNNGDFLWEKISIENPIFGYGITRFSDVSKSGNIFTFVSQAGETFLTTIDMDGYETLSLPISIPDSVSLSTNNTTEIYRDSLILNSLQYFFSPTGPCCSSIQITDTLGNFKDEIVLPLDWSALTTDIEITFDNKILAVTTYDSWLKKIMLTKYNENFEYDSIYTRPYTYDSLCPGGINSGSIDLGCSVITGIKDEIKEGHAKLTLAPNPARDFTIVYLPETIVGNEKQGPFDVTTFRTDYARNLGIEIFDINGKTVHQADWPDGIKEQVLSTSTYTPGLYLIRVNGPNGIIATGKLLINR